MVHFPRARFWIAYKLPSSPGLPNGDEDVCGFLTFINEGQDYGEHKPFPPDTQGIALDARPEGVLFPNGAWYFVDLILPSFGTIFEEG